MYFSLKKNKLEQIEKIIPIGFLLFVLQIVVKILILKKAGVKPGNSDKNQKKSPLLYLIYTPIFLLFMFEMLRPVLSFSFFIVPRNVVSPLFNSKLIGIVGIGIMLMSELLLLISLIHFKKSLRFGLNAKNQDRLVTNGIFSLSRNPFFVSIELLFLGVSLIHPSLFFMLFTGIAIISIHFFILKEEHFLINHYGEEYSEYSKKVRRYF